MLLYLPHFPQKAAIILSNIYPPFIRVLPERAPCVCDSVSSPFENNSSCTRYGAILVATHQDTRSLHPFHIQHIPNCRSPLSLQTRPLLPSKMPTFLNQIMYKLHIGAALGTSMIQRRFARWIDLVDHLRVVPKEDLDGAEVSMYGGTVERSVGLRGAIGGGG